ncbi:MAG: hypothetical protein P4L95_23365 [Rouxiella aceris]|uniref:hypothetical protein n=1 Tax=Rouxiella aceris TaxID=2703884 RepID=UPI00283F43C3|nr:hypothetical protein [Rouxiella aceris]MDR3434805.1 hypothetical protein [Rouxiella aceris]
MKGLTKGEKQELSRSLHPGVIINDLWHLREVRCDKPVMCRNPLELSRRNKSSITYSGASKPLPAKKRPEHRLIKRRNNGIFYLQVQA